MFEVDLMWELPWRHLNMSYEKFVGQRVMMHSEHSLEILQEEQQSIYLKTPNKQNKMHVKMTIRLSNLRESNEHFVVKPCQQALADSFRMELYLRFLDEAPSEHL